MKLFWSSFSYWTSSAVKNFGVQRVFQNILFPQVVNVGFS